MGSPHAKDGAGALGAAAATIIVFIATKAGLDMSADESVGVTGAASVILSYVASRLTAA